MWWITAIGFTAQACFSARILTQWMMSEKAGRSLSPNIYWIFSLLGAYLLCLYGYLRHDFSIVLGQVISYYIYIWNLDIKGLWTKLPVAIRFVLMLTPVVAVAGVAQHAGAFFRTATLPGWLIAFGSVGQVIFTLRFVYQFFYSKHHGESLLPPTFWAISLVGSMIIVCYGILRVDWVLILGQSVGFVSYTRNLMLGLQREGHNA